MKRSIALLCVVGLTASAQPRMLTAEDVKNIWIKNLAAAEAMAAKKAEPERSKELRKISNDRRAIQEGYGDEQAQKAAVVSNARTLRQSARADAPRAAEMPPLIEDQSLSEQPRDSAAEWASIFGGQSTDSAQRQRYADDITKHNQAIANARLSKARSLALQCEQITGRLLVLAEDDPKKLSAQIQGMEQILARDERQRATVSAAGTQVDSEKAWRSQQFLEQLRSLQTSLAYPPLRGGR